MPEPIPAPLTLERDGTGQAERRLPGLDPETAAIDERGLSDWLAFAQAYSKELAYYGPDNQPAGDWSGFLNPGGLGAEGLPARWREIESFLAEPERFGDDSAHRRPHFVLFLAYLRLLGLAQQRLNRLTGQHLDFYYQKFLSLEKQAARPDRVNILARPTADAAEALLPKGTLLEAGKDSLGGELFYRTDEELSVNRAQVKSLYSVFVDKKTTGIQQAREETAKTNANPLLAMFSLVYGDPLPPFRPDPNRPDEKPLDAAFLDKLRELVNFVRARLRMNFQEFRRLMSLKNLRGLSMAGDWRTINDVLKIISLGAGTGEAFPTPEAGAPEEAWRNFRDFKANLKKALGKAPDFSGLPHGITGLEDLYAHRTGENEQEFINGILHLTMAEFETMMRKKMEVDNDWRIVNGLLEIAGQHRFEDLASPEFGANLQDALGTLDFSGFQEVFGVNDLDRFSAALGQVEAYFHCSLADFARIMAAGEKEKDSDPKKKPTPAEWARVYAILAAAFTKKVYAGHLEQLNRLKPADKSHQKDALEAMLRLALGERLLAAGKLPDLLDAYWPQGEAGKATLATLKAAMSDSSPAVLDEQRWKNIIDALEQAWRKREGAPPVAQKQEWLNLYATADATSVKSATLGGTPRWRTFGQGRQAPAKDQPPAPLLGWAIASPVFCLSQGRREVTLTLVFQADSFGGEKIAALLRISDQNPDYPLLVEASSAKGWMVPSTLTIESASQLASASSPPVAANALRLKLGFDVSAPPVAALPNAESRWPMIRLLLRPAWQESTPKEGRYATPYPLFQALVLERVLIEADVVGLKDLRLENDEGSLAAGKPFEPFGFSPSVGSGFQFVHPELVAKRLDRLDANLEWMKVPAADLTAHYKNYPDIQAADAAAASAARTANPAAAESAAAAAVAANANAKFTAKISLVDHRLEIPLLAQAVLFDTGGAGDARKAHTVSIADIPSLVPDGYAYVPELAPFSLADPASWPRYFRLELNAPDFQHGSYAKVSAAKSIEFAAAIAAKYAELAAVAAGGTPPSSPLPNPDAADYQVNPPYTPKLKSFSVDYGCSVEIAMNAARDDPQAYGNGEERMFYRQAFGVAEIQPGQGGGACRLLPSYGHEGELYIGLEGVDVSRGSQDVAILFQMAEGSANPDLEPQPVEWGYLSGNQWLSLSGGGVLADSTGGLVQSGIIKFRLRQAAPNTLLPAKLYWLRAAVAQHCDSLCDTVDIKAQAVAATWIDRGNAPDHLSQPLPAGTISKTASPLPGIASVSQPYTSYGGKPGEQDALFNGRVSERLRHKQRALTLWDYEHLILERFPGIYKAKCIPASSAEPGDLGKVDVIVIPDIRNRLPFNPFEPKATADQIAEIGDFLKGYVSPLAEVKVKNAHYVPVKARFAVRFMPGHDPGHHKTLLNEELNRFLSPWAYEESNEVVIGGKIYANAIVDFLERRPYVDYVAELKLFINEDGLGPKLVIDTGGEDGYRAQTSLPDGVLVAESQHDIVEIKDAGFEDAIFIGIGYMKIELDFIVAYDD